ncbi:MAG: hypothetical protein V3U26_02050 [Dehalococcoidia bacterium]
MTIVRQYLWICAVVFGIVFLALGSVFVYQGLDTKAEIRAELLEEKVTTSDDAVEFGAPAGVPVQDMSTAKAQANVIEMHSVERYGRYTEMERDDPNRDTYLNGLTLRNALSIAAMGFGVSDLVIGTGAAILLIGFLTLVVGVPALYWAKAAEGQVVREVSRRVGGTAVAAPASS